MDTSHAESTKRIAKNTVFLYGRMLIGMLVSLYTSRVILEALGVEDYGIYNVVGGLVAMFSLISSSLSSSISRFLTFELGAGNEQRLKEVFATSLMIQIAMCGVVLVAAETIGLWLVNTKLVIPPDRMFAANCIFQVSTLSFMLGLLSMPYSAILVSHERMNIFAYFGLAQIFANLGIVLFIQFAPWHFDRMIVYSILQCSVGVIMQLSYYIYCRHHFAECRVAPQFHKSCWRQMSGFAGWNAIGCTAGILKDQGVNILLNIFFGPVVNAARGIAVSVNTAVTSFAGNFMTAVHPQITKSYASNDKAYCFSLVERGSRFGYYIIMMLSLPILLDTPFILKLWLKNYPEWTVVFVRFVLIYSMLEVLSSTLINLQMSTGKIRNYQLAVGGLLLMNFPLSWICLKFGAAPYSVYIVALGVGVGCLLLRLWFLRNMAGLSMSHYLRHVVVNVGVTNICSAIIPAVIYLNMPLGFLRFVTVGLASVVCGAVSVLYIGCSSAERGFILSKVSSIKKKVTKGLA